MGLIGFALLLIAEFAVVLWLRGLTLNEYFAGRDPVSGTVYYVMLIVFAMMPLLLVIGLIRRKGPPGKGPRRSEKAMFS
jgi:hypothetical protein